jgi:hypothetical protein
VSRVRRQRSLACVAEEEDGGCSVCAEQSHGAR